MKVTLKKIVFMLMIVIISMVADVEEKNNGQNGE